MALYKYFIDIDIKMFLLMFL